jgi:hypothetical protein
VCTHADTRAQKKLKFSAGHNSCVWWSLTFRDIRKPGIAVNVHKGPWRHQNESKAVVGNSEGQRTAGQRCT